MRLQTCLLSVLLTGQALAVRMSDRFTISSTCIDVRVHLDPLMADTIDLAENAISALDRLLEGGSELNAISWHGSSPTPGNLQDAYLLAAANKAFGVARPSDFKDQYNGRDKQQLRKARDNFVKVRDALVHGVDMDPAHNFFHCDSNLFEWVTRAADVFEDDRLLHYEPDMSMKDYLQMRIKIPVGGGWKDPDHKVGLNYNFIPDEDDGKPPCEVASAATYTYTIAGANIRNIFMCRRSWELHTTDLSEIKRMSGYTPWDLKLSGNLPSILLHEMMHWLVQSDMIVDHKINIGGRLVAVYNMIACFAFSNQQGYDGYDKSVTNADSYRVFALMVYAKGATFVPLQQQ